MLSGIFLIIFFAFLGVVTHKNSRFVNKAYRDVPLNEWFVFIALPLFLYSGWVLIVRDILLRPRVDLLPLDDFDILAMAVFALVFAFTGNAMHFVAKVLWRYLKDNPKSKAYRVNEMFHNKLSHYLVYFNGMFVAFSLILLEINHPLPNGDMVLFKYIAELVFAGIVFGLAVGKSYLYTDEWFGGYAKALSIVWVFLLGIMLALGYHFRMSFWDYPTYVFVVSLFVTTFLVFVFRFLFILSRLNEKKRLKFISRYFSLNSA